MWNFDKKGLNYKKFRREDMKHDEQFLHVWKKNSMFDIHLPNRFGLLKSYDQFAVKQDFRSHENMKNFRFMPQ
jgi:hypothetical protein